MAKRKCSICDTAVDVEDMHPDNRNFTRSEFEKIMSGDTSFSVSHAGCAAGEDSWSGANPSDEELADSRAWITER